MSTISERALEYAKYKGMTAAEFERVCGLANGMLKKLSDKTRFQTYKRIGMAFPDFNLIWLKTGKGEMVYPDHLQSDVGTQEETSILQGAIAMNPQLPTTSDNPTISELLEIIRSQQETIKTLSETVNRQSETVRELTKNK